MAVAAYTTDLTTLDQAGEGAVTTGWAEGTEAAGTLVSEPDFFIQGSYCIAKYMTSGGVGVGTCLYDAGGSITIPSPGAFFVWTMAQCPNNVDTLANGGVRVCIGSGLAAYRSWYVGGKDTDSYGGWKCYPVDPTVAGSVDSGAPNMAAKRYFGAGVKQLANAKGGFGVDVIRYGRGEARIAGGTAPDAAATFAGYAAQNDNGTNRWGLLSATPGGYNQQGLVIFGYGAACRFTDSNTSILIQNTTKVTAAFNAFEVRNVSSVVTLTSISFTALGTTARGNWITTDNATVSLNSCTFTDTGTMGFLSNTTATSCVFRRTGQITQGGSTITGCTIDSNRDSALGAISSAAPNLISNCSFISGGTGHGIVITAAGTYSFNGNTFTGYNMAGAGSNLVPASGSTDACIYNNSGGAVTLNLSGGTTPSVRNGAGATTTVNSSVSVTLTGLKNPSEVRVFNAGTTTEVPGTGAENVITGSHTFSIGSGVSVDIVVLSLGYQNMRILAYSTTANASVPISQVIDRQYLNP